MQNISYSKKSTVVPLKFVGWVKFRFSDLLLITSKQQMLQFQLVTGISVNGQSQKEQTFCHRGPPNYTIDSTKSNQMN